LKVYKQRKKLSFIFAFLAFYIFFFSKFCPELVTFSRF
jgi:hypothetical protein